MFDILIVKTISHATQSDKITWSGQTLERNNRDCYVSTQVDCTNRVVVLSGFMI